MIGKAFAREVGDLIRYDAKVTRIQQDDRGVTVTYTDLKAPATPQQAKADWCVCTIPLSILSQIPSRRRRPHEGRHRCRALLAVGQDRPAVQAPLLGGGRGDLRRHQLHRPADPADRLSKHRLQRAPAGACCSAPICSTAPTPTNSPRCRRPSALRARSNSAPAFIRNTAPNTRTALPWPGIGCPSPWAAPATGPTRRGREHYDDLCQIDGRIVLAGEHASYIPAWQEGAILSSLDAITRLHDRVVKTMKQRAQFDDAWKCEALRSHRRGDVGGVLADLASGMRARHRAFGV